MTSEEILAYVDAHPDATEADMVASQRAHVRQMATINRLARMYREGVLKRERTVIDGQPVTYVRRVVSEGGA